MVDAFKPKWFTELSPLWAGQAMSLQYTEVLEDVKSDYQHVQILKTAEYGNMLVLDGVIQVTERDEFAYQEMMVHLPMLSHPNPENVLIIGGGDGGVLREVLKHPSVKTATQCEIDGKVIELCKTHLPGLAKSYDDPKATVIVGDGFKYMQEHENEFDVIITDSSDPIGRLFLVLTPSMPWALVRKVILSVPPLPCSRSSTTSWSRRRSSQMVCCARKESVYGCILT
eukprot:TRINITY_DN6841_c0_g1_i2.p1 TRINITY_DN6841_c0_g1~~TRINITY_DN6841_c0_g1_i2.p1  ORF type:complete len:227 (+),score=43.51 TRINITY_DN6841_c0_g1_i2:51-731(+)